MTKIKGVGQSKVTLEKEQGFAWFLQLHIGATQAIFRKHSWAVPVYWYIDMNAGSGFNDIVECNGSPLIFLSSASLHQLNFRAYFIEREPVLTDQLLNRIGHCFPDFCRQKPQRIWVATGNNQDFVPYICRKMPFQVWNYGLIYHDPNGQADMDSMARFSEFPVLRSVDMLIRYNATAIKRNAYRTGRDLLQDIDKIQKKHLMIRTINQSDPWHWTFLYFSNWGGLREWKAKGFVYADSKEGIATLERLLFTNDQLKAKYAPRFQWEADTETIQNI